VHLRLPHGQKVGRAADAARWPGPTCPAAARSCGRCWRSILAEATRAAGAEVRLGCTFTSIEQDADGVDVTFTDGQRRRYDLVIGADGLYSKVREALFPDAPKPRYSGQAVWRAVLPRPPEVQTITMWMGPRVKPGVNPVSKDEMYLFVTEHRPSNDPRRPGELRADG
jgi:2-polyprenyl-6-methoxyphenol hydroxylase-like FAD-dependent oxidoreductase